MQPEIYTINLTVPAEWDKLDDHQLRYVFGQLAQGFPSPLALPQVLRLSHATEGVLRGEHWQRILWLSF